MPPPNPPLIRVLSDPETVESLARQRPSWAALWRVAVRSLSRDDDRADDRDIEDGPSDDEETAA